MVDNDFRFVVVPITLCCNVENAIHILVLHLEDIPFAQKFAKLNVVILLQTFEDRLMLVRRPKVSRDFFHIVSCCLPLWEKQVDLKENLNG